MKEFLTVLTYTFKENSRKKIFIISTIITLILTVLIVSLPAIIKNFDNNDKNKTEQGIKIDQTKPKDIVFIIDSKGILIGNSNKLGKTFSDYVFKFETINNIDSLKNKVKEEGNSSLLILDKKNGIPTFDYSVKQADSGINPTELSRFIKSVFVTDLLKAAKVPDKVSQIIQKDIS